jgi:hypothetical protein
MKKARAARLTGRFASAALLGWRKLNWCNFFVSLAN